MPQTTLTPTVDEAALTKRLGTGPGDATEVDRVLVVATRLLDDALSTAETVETLPEQEVYDDMILTVATDLYARRRTSGQQLTAAQDGRTAPRPPRDPLANVRAILARYVVPF